MTDASDRTHASEDRVSYSGGSAIGRTLLFVFGLAAVALWIGFSLATDGGILQALTSGQATPPAAEQGVPTGAEIKPGQ